MDRMRFIFEDVIRHAKLKGHLDMTDVRRLPEIGIPITTLCIKNTPIDNIEKYARLSSTNRGEAIAFQVDSLNTPMSIVSVTASGVTYKKKENITNKV